MSRTKGAKNKPRAKMPVVMEAPLPVGMPAGSSISKYRMHPFLGADLDTKIDMLAKALINNSGFFTGAANDLKVDIRTISHMVEKSDYLAYVVAQIKYKKWDNVEKLVWDKAMEGDENNLKRICTHKDWKARGYETKPEVQLTQNTFKQVIITVPGEESRTLLQSFDSKNLLDENNESI